MPISKHLSELRRVLMVSVVAIFVLSMAAFIGFGDALFELVAKPIKLLDVPMIYIGVTEGFFTKVKLAILAGIIGASPIVLSFIWLFVAPALDAKERKKMVLAVPLSLICFLAGVLFAYFVILRFALNFLLISAVADEDIRPMLSIGKYVSFLISFIVPFGITFEMPLAVYFLSKHGVVSYAFLKRNRRYAILVTFIIAAVLTPGPDIISQTLMAGPMLLLYEISTWIARAVEPRAPNVAEQM